MTDRAGNSAVIDLSTATTIEDILTTISNAPGLNVTATLNAVGNGIAIIDNHASPTQNLMVEEVGGGTTAKELGILADRSSDIVGTPLHPAVTPSTPLALLYEGQGVVPSTVRITNGAVEVEVDLSSALTLDDVITTINAAGVNVTASINAEGTALDVRSNDASTVAIVTDMDGGTTAADLGIQGGRDVLKTLQYLEEALQRDDLPALDRLLTQLDAGLAQVLSLRSEVGARLHRVQLAQEQNAAKGLAVTSLLSQTQDADAMETFSRLTQQSFAFEAALASTAEMMQPTLLDFLR
jgi:flagellin-like hook-associated protein FlgL